MVDERGVERGANTITAVATDQAGLTTSKAVSVTYAPPPPPVAHASQVGSAKGKNGKVSSRSPAKERRARACEVESTLDHRREDSQRQAGGSVREAPPQIRATKVIVGSSKLTIPAGQKVTIAIALNATGKPAGPLRQAAGRI